MSLTMMQKRDDFAGWLQELLRVHDDRFVVDTLERKELEQPADRKTLLSVTGQPVRYGVVMDIGQTSTFPDGLDGAGNVCDYAGHRFDVRLFWGKEYATTYSKHSQSGFEAAVYNASDAALPGLLATVRENRTRYVGTAPYYIGIGSGDALDNVQRGTWDFGDIGRPDLAHLFSFNVTLY